MFHLKLIELESELLAKEQSKQGFEKFPYACEALIEHVEKEIGVRLADKVPQDWRGWLSYRREADSLIVLRGRAFADGGMFGKWKAGCDVPYGLDTVTEYARHFAVTPPAELDHLLLNFGQAESARVFLWYGENVAEYKLIFMADVQDDPHHELGEAIVEACTWILKRPKDKTILEFLKEKER
jgi:hypothetical protein